VSESETLKTASRDADTALARMGERYFGFCSELRSAKLNRRESTLLLKGLGLAKSRISEILRVSEVTDEVWAKYKAGQIGFNATLALGRGSDGTGVSDSEAEGESESKPASNKKKEKRLPKEFQPSIVACLEDWGDSLNASGVKDPYVMRWEDKDKRTYVVSIQPIDAEAKA